jgi:hypothetical protein
MKVEPKKLNLKPN